MANALFRKTSTEFVRVRNLRHLSDIEWIRNNAAFWLKAVATEPEQRWHWSTPSWSTGGRTRNTVIESNHSISRGTTVWFAKTTTPEQESGAYIQWAQFAPGTSDHLVSPVLTSEYPYQCLLDFMGFGTYLLYIAKSAFYVGTHNLLYSSITPTGATTWQYDWVDGDPADWERIGV